MDDPPATAQSDYTYEQVSFLDPASGIERRGTVGWCEGIRHRVTFHVWDGPSSEGAGDNLFAAFAAARTAIEGQGFVPLVAGADDTPPQEPHALFEPVSAGEVELLRQADDVPLIQPALWWIAALIVVLGLAYPLLAGVQG